jgi:cytochrome P450
MRRVALGDVQISDGTRIRKGEILAVDAGNMWDPAVYENPNKWDGYRFLKLRESAEGQHTAQLVSTSPNHLGFGHGQHACPGRFFAANEVKIIMAQMLLKYDFKLSDGAEPKLRRSGFSVGADPTMKMMIRRRQEEIAV